MNTKEYENWLVQLRKGFLELCVLLILKKSNKAYGLEILKKLNKADLKLNEGTIYPLLNRMNNNNLLESNWDTDKSHPRRFYSLNKQGEDILPFMLKTYKENDISLKFLESDDE